MSYSVTSRAWYGILHHLKYSAFDLTLIMDQNQKELKAPVPAHDQVSDGLEIGSSSDVVSKSLEKAYGK